MVQFYCWVKFRVSWDKKVSVKEWPWSYWSLGMPVGIFLITNWCSADQSTNIKKLVYHKPGKREKASKQLSCLVAASIPIQAHSNRSLPEVKAQLLYSQFSLAIILLITVAENKAVHSLPPFFHFRFPLFLLYILCCKFSPCSSVCSQTCDIPDSASWILWL